MGVTYLPINSSWKKYTEKSERTFCQIEGEMKKILVEKAEDALELLEGEKCVLYLNLFGVQNPF